MKVKFIIQSNKSINWYKRAYASRYVQDADQTYILLFETNILFGCEILINLVICRLRKYRINDKGQRQ